MNVSKKLNVRDTDLLRAIIAGGARPGRPYETTAAVLVQRLGVKKGENHETLLTDGLRRLVRAEYSYENVGMKHFGPILSHVGIYDDGRVTVTVNVDTGFVATL